MRETEGVLSALYLRGLARPFAPPRRGWRDVEACLRRSWSDLGGDLGSAARVLAREGLWQEAAVLEAPGLLAQAERLVELGRVCTAASPGYPARWHRLGSAAPPALWQAGSAPACLSSITVVGSRQLSSAERRLAVETGAAVSQAGRWLVSGGAVGVDRLAARAAAHALVVLPCGLEVAPRPEGDCLLSLCSPRESFSAAAAMERNALLYAASDLSIVVTCRDRQGGSWHGAVAALRRRLSAVWVYPSARLAPANGARGLRALGARELFSPSDLELALSAPAWPAGLFPEATFSCAPGP